MNDAGWFKVKRTKCHCALESNQSSDMSSSSAVTFSLSLYSDLRVVKTGGQPLLKFILRYLSRHSLNLSPMEKYGEWEKTRHFKSTSTTQFTLCLKNDYKIQKWSKKQELGILKEGIQGNK